ncbi:hypothetical protein [Oceanirhabdus sp. W0125-5]|uniref:hypothetical protein n=1 Tax=Oceanirhabdus sp. W0125-5 TaxID=2999116 RepID=UPI0022F32293|nr:hypothetical protein [Oceanirhabdus sp. W0125-5]WBW97433.1 hypothetical protein OW730_00835 [Oceanirhabdus sp. W0125-5]
MKRRFLCLTLAIILSLSFSSILLHAENTKSFKYDEKKIKSIKLNKSSRNVNFKEIKVQATSKDKENLKSESKEFKKTEKLVRKAKKKYPLLKENELIEVRIYIDFDLSDFEFQKIISENFGTEFKMKKHINGQFDCVVNKKQLAMLESIDEIFLITTPDEEYEVIDTVEVNEEGKATNESYDQSALNAANETLGITKSLQTFKYTGDSWIQTGYINLN